MDAMWSDRFGGVARLYGGDAAERLQAAHVCVVGVGGVGSWTVEALARSGIGALTLVDLDDVCVTNINRQLPALEPTVGRPKVEVLAERIRDIHPQCAVHPRTEFFTATTAEAILGESRFDVVVDAIDSVANKCLLIAKCREAGIPVVVSGGAGGRRDPTAIRVADLALTVRDTLLKHVRKRLRQAYGFPREEKVPFGVPAVYSEEMPVYPWSDGSVCAKPEDGRDAAINCEGGIGTASFVTGAFGLALASVAVSGIAGGAFARR